MLDGNHARSDVGDELGNEDGAETGDGAGGVFQHLRRDGFHTADTGTDNHADPVRIFFLDIDLCVIDSLVGRDDGELCKMIVLAGFLAIEAELLGVVPLYLAGKFGLKKGDIEAVDQTGSADSLIKVLKVRRDVVAKRVDRPETGDYNSFHDDLFIVDCFFDVVDCVFDRGDFFCHFFRNLDVKHLLELHDEFYGIQGICTEVVCKTSRINDFAFVHTKFVNDDGLNFCSNIFHSESI